MNGTTSFDQGLGDAVDAVRDEEATRGDGLAARLRVLGPPLIVLGLVIAGWYFASTRLLDPERAFLLPPPDAVLTEGLLAEKPRGEILAGLLESTKVALTGLGIAFLIGSTMALAMSQAKWIERSLYPYAVILQTVPILAIVPLLGFWFGFGFTSRVVVCVIIALFPLVINTLNGLLSADGGLHDLMTIHDASRWTRLSKLQIPAALPDLFVGLRTSAGLSVIGAIVGDFFFGRGTPGLGMLLSRYASRLSSEALLAAVLVSCLLGVAVFSLFGAIGRRAVGDWAETRSHPGAR